MKFVAATLLAMAWGVTASAASFASTGAVQQYVVPTTGTYQLILSGAQGGKGGGLGATVQGNVFLTAGTILNVVVGVQGVEFFNFGAGGGGGSFISVSGTATLLAAAGGGGGSSFNTSGEPGQAGTSGSNGGGTGGTNGSGGLGSGVGGGGGGAGWLGAGASSVGVNTGGGGQSGPTFTGGPGAGGAGGFGGGGGGGGRAGGGGGGYSGGGGGVFAGNGEQGGGGGSFLAASATSQSFQSGVNAGNGAVEINLVSISVGQSFQISYFPNLNLGDGVINITNPGTLGAGLAAGTSASTTGAICVNAYAFSPDEQMIACCSCPVTPNGLVSLSAKDDLISNTLTPAVPTSIVVKLLATVPQGGSCAGSASTVATLTLADSLAAWGTKVHPSDAGRVLVTEAPFLAGTLSLGEVNRLGNLCTFINATGSGFGICRSCRLGGLGAGRL